MSAKLTVLTRETGWYGSHSGYYEQLSRWYRRLDPSCRVVQARNTTLRRIVGGLYARLRRLPQRNQTLTAGEMAFALRRKLGGGIGHVLSFEDHAPMFARAGRRLENCFTTIHFPPSALAENDLDALKNAAGAILLYERDVEFFSRILGEGRVRFVPHGADLEFFRPAATAPSAPRACFVGQFMRNIPMLARVAPALLSRVPGLEIDLVVPAHAVSKPAFSPLRDLPGIHWHTGISDDQLLEVYQSATIALLPMDESGANNAVVEPLAVGVPLVTTDVGGIRSYGGGTLFPVVPNNDDDAMIVLAEGYFGNPDLRASVSVASRRFAEEKLGWEHTTRQHRDALADMARV